MMFSDLINSYFGNFVIERKVVNSDYLKRLNPSSCNTARIHTWRNRTKGEIEFVSAFLRVGRKGEIVDNGFAGGIAIPIDSNGCLSNSGCTLSPYKRIEDSPTGIQFKGYKLDDFAGMVEVAKRGHELLPHFDFIGWDVTVDDSGNVVVIEFNADPDMRLDQLIFLNTCLLEHQKDILSMVL